VDTEAQQIADPFDDHRPAAGVAQGQGVGPEQQHRPDDIPRQRVADTDGMGDEKILLKLGRVGGIDVGVARSPKPVVTP